MKKYLEEQLTAEYGVGGWSERNCGDGWVEVDVRRPDGEVEVDRVYYDSNGEITSIEKVIAS
ncbi:hypothetical protein DLM_4185 [Aquitalea magnusonii]|uniref:PepSY domain-containing protein n=1 Tax=Aquitalea magnusonii TaxID=332411 RepID=A0A3G9GIN3_9NEIS|nr:hypothetical protein [Aquitalea magnusonii]BBF87758.1 hypothetical protein DLM_4185 [Aquitalea magnusonii]